MDLSSALVMICRTFSPPQPIESFYYRCDKRFHLESILDMYREDTFIPVVSVTGEDAIFYLVGRSTVKTLEHIKTKLPSQHKTGGQSAVRFERIRDELVGGWVTRICERLTKYYTTNGLQHNGVSRSSIGDNGVSRSSIGDSIICIGGGDLRKAVKAKSSLNVWCESVLTEPRQILEQYLETVTPIDHEATIAELINNPRTSSRVVFGDAIAHFPCERIFTPNVEKFASLCQHITECDTIYGDVGLVYEGVSIDLAIE